MCAEFSNVPLTVDSERSDCDFSSFDLLFDDFSSSFVAALDVGSSRVVARGRDEFKSRTAVQL